MRTKIYVLVVTLWSGLSLGTEVSGDPCGCLASVPPGDHVLLICPQGDGPTLAEKGAIITLIYTELLYPQFAYSYHGGCSQGIVWCGDAPTSDSLTGLNMQTTVSGSFAGGGYASEFVWEVIQMGLPPCSQQYAPVVLVSPDFNADLVVELADFSMFGLVYKKPWMYDPRMDLNADGEIELSDFSLFGLHYKHSCSD